ncbi:MAG: ABC transporter substrate-binding protein, partial [Roseococcus sp.]
MISRRTLGLTALAAPFVSNAALAQGTRLRWAHVYEVNEPYHTEALWAAGQIQQRTNGRWNIEVFA